jgi:hypothetical protein
MSQKLKETIDRMVEESVRRILPQVMNEILVKTLANANVIGETRSAPQRAQAPAQPQRKAAKGQRPSSLSQLLDESAGADFYKDPNEAMYRATQEEAPPQPAGQVIAQRIQNLPPALQGLAEGIDLDDDGGEMWESQYGDSFPTAPMGPPIEKAAAAIGLDFSRMAKAINITEKKTAKVAPADRAANAQFEQARLKRMREKLNDGKPVE